MRPAETLRERSMSLEPMKSTPASRAFVIFGGLILTTVFVVFFGLKLIADARTEAINAAVQSELNAQAIEDVHETQRIVLAVTGCTETMTSEECQERQREAGVQAIREVDCRTYRALRGEPPLEPGQSCLTP